jgi:two-component system, sensor histidine kinase and response regulator
LPTRDSGQPDPTDFDTAEALPDFDTVAGLDRVAQNQQLYLDLLFSFARKHADAGARITDHLHQKELELAADLAHTIKGMAGNLGATGIQAAAQCVETACRRDPADTEKTAGFAAELEAALARAVSDIRTLEATLAEKDATNRSDPADAPPDRMDKDALCDLIQQIRRLIQSDYNQALHVAGDMARRLRQTPEESLGTDLLDRLNDFDDTGALALLDVLHESTRVSGDASYESKDESENPSTG